MDKPIVLVLAGGQSSRFWPLSDKNQMPMIGKPLLQWQLEKLKTLGFNDIILISNKNTLNTLIGPLIRPLTGPDPVRVIKQDKMLPGMAGAILSAKKLYQSRYKGKPLYIINANDFYEDALHHSVLNAAKKKPAFAHLAAYKLKQYQPMGYLKINKGKIVNIVEKPGKGKEPSDMVNIVAHLYSQPQELFRALRTFLGEGQGASLSSVPDDHYERTIARLMKKKQFLPVKYEGEWHPLKYPWHLLSVMKYFLNSRKDTPFWKEGFFVGRHVSSKATIKGRVYLEKGVRVFEGAKIIGPTWIGEGSIIGNNSLVRESHIGRNCVIGYSSDITRSYIGDNCWTHTNYIGDSILDKNVSLGSGAVTANLRLDESNIYSHIKGEKTDSQQIKLGAIIGANTRIGVNASLMPGVKIGSDSIVGPNVVLQQDLKSGQVSLVSQKLITKPNRWKVSEKTRNSFKNKI